MLLPSLLIGKLRHGAIQSLWIRSPRSPNSAQTSTKLKQKAKRPFGFTTDTGLGRSDYLCQICCVHLSSFSEWQVAILPLQTIWLGCKSFRDRNNSFLGTWIVLTINRCSSWLCYWCQWWGRRLPNKLYVEKLFFLIPPDYVTLIKSASLEAEHYCFPPHTWKCMIVSFGTEIHALSIQAAHIMTCLHWNLAKKKKSLSTPNQWINKQLQSHPTYNFQKYLHPSLQNQTNQEIPQTIICVHVSLRGICVGWHCFAVNPCDQDRQVHAGVAILSQRILAFLLHQ